MTVSDRTSVLKKFSIYVKRGYPINIFGKKNYGALFQVNLTREEGSPVGYLSRTA